MDTLNQQITNNINSIIYQKYSTGVTQLNIEKILAYIKNKFNIDADVNLLSDIVLNNKNVLSIDEKNIILGNKESQENMDVSDEIHDNAVQQASDNLRQESIVDIISKLNTGDFVDSYKIHLNESDIFYHLHKSAIKNEKKYIIGDIIPNKDLKKTVVECKIDGTGLFLNIPIVSFYNIFK